MKHLIIPAILMCVTVALTGAEPTKPATQPATTKPAKPPAPDQLLNSMLKPSDTGKILQPGPESPKYDATSDKAVAPNAPPMKLRREGTTLNDVVGRLTRAADGQQWELALDSDGRAMQDPPLIILPNLNLAAMESAVNNASRDLRFRVTGVVTEYKGRNYILLEKVVVPPEQVGQF